MIFEKIMFNIIAFAIFTIIFFKMLHKNDTSYVYILVIEFIGIVINFIELLLGTQLNLFFKTLMYVLSVIIPGIVLLIEYKNKSEFPEFLNITIAKFLIASEKNEEAKKYLFNLINKYPKSYNAHKLLAELYEKEGNYENAVGEYIRATEINNKNILINYKIAEMLNKQKKNEEAIEILQDMLKRQPEYYKATNLLGEILYTEERYKEAISVYMNALRYNPGNYDLYYSLGMAYTMVNDFQRAKEFYEKAAQINSLLYNAKLNLGQIALIYGDLEEAESFFLESINGEEAEAGSYYYLSQVAMLKGETEKAKNYMNIAVQLEPENYEKAQKEPVFMPIKKEIEPPKEEMQEIKKIEPNEKKAREHLSKTCSLVGKLNNNDLKMMTNLKKKQREERTREEN